MRPRIRLRQTPARQAREAGWCVGETLARRDMEPKYAAMRNPFPALGWRGLRWLMTMTEKAAGGGQQRAEGNCKQDNSYAYYFHGCNFPLC
jgi:hypothetical protein